MDYDSPVPSEKLKWFQTKVNLDKEAFMKLDPYRPLFLDDEENFTEYFFTHFHEISETRIYLDHEEHKGHLQMLWLEWFVSLFSEDFSEDFLAYHWTSGLRHVELGIDHRFITLAYSHLRQFCQESTMTGIP